MENEDYKSTDDEKEEEILKLIEEKNNFIQSLKKLALMLEKYNPNQEKTLDKFNKINSKFKL